MDDEPPGGSQPHCSRRPCSPAWPCPVRPPPRRPDMARPSQRCAPPRPASRAWSRREGRLWPAAGAGAAPRVHLVVRRHGRDGLPLHQRQPARHDGRSDQARSARLRARRRTASSTSSRSKTSSSRRRGSPRTAPTMPRLFGEMFMATGEPNRYAIPAFFSLHLWLYQDEPGGPVHAVQPDGVVRAAETASAVAPSQRPAPTRPGRAIAFACRSVAEQVHQPPDLTQPRQATCSCRAPTGPVVRRAAGPSRPTVVRPGTIDPSTRRRRRPRP